MNHRIFGRFTKTKGFIYRTDTFIQFGDSEEIIGSFALCNPGSSRLDDSKEQKRLEEYNGHDDYIVEGELKSDPAMKQLIKIIEKSNALEKEGRFMIYNLFTLRNAKMSEALKQFIDPNIDKELLEKDYKDYRAMKNKLPWTLIGWGCKDDLKLNKMKIKWLDYIAENKLNKLGYKHKKSPHYYHPLPMVFKKRIEYIEYIVPKLDELIESISKDSIREELIDSYDNLFDINDFRLRRLMNKNHSIREFGDRYEYCFIKEYEEKYNNFTLDSIDFGDCFVQILSLKEEQILVSIDFPKSIFDMETVLNYVDFYGFKLLKEGEFYINGASEVLEAKKFRGKPILCYERGLGVAGVDLESLIEVTEDFQHSQQRINTGSSKTRDSILPKSKIFLNDEEIDYVPEIEIKPFSDLIISNGHLIVASYIGDYCGCIGFFEEKDDDLPIAWIYDKETTVYIDIHERENQKIIAIEYNYAINLDDFD